jgi:flavodoxin
MGRRSRESHFGVAPRLALIPTLDYSTPGARLASHPAMAAKQASPRVLIVYYSRSGRTESVAMGLARASGADVEALLATSNRRGFAGYLLSSFEAIFEREAGIHPPTRNPSDYDIVLIGTPTWDAALSSPIRTYLDRYAGDLPEVGFFVTCGRRGGERVVEQMRYISGKTPLATLALSERELERHASVYFGEFWERLLCAWERRSGTSHARLGHHELPTPTQVRAATRADGR